MTDVVVCGGGPAGACAALAASRTGASVRLIESRGALGGMMTTGLLPWILNKKNKTGVVRELVESFRDRAYSPIADGPGTFDAEKIKLILEEYCSEAGVEIRYHSMVSEACIEDSRITAVVTESKSGREAWRGKVFVDATGDGDLAALAGCSYEKGQEGGGGLQPMSLIVMVSGIKFREVKPFVNHVGDDPKNALRMEIERAGVLPSYSRPGLFRTTDDSFCLMANHVYGVDGTSADDITRATIQARSEAHRQIDGLRSLGGVWRDIRITGTAAHIGVRETRRIKGLYTVTLDDMVQGKRHSDAVCEVRAGIDVHSPDPVQSRGNSEVCDIKIAPYDIPLRALITADVKNLLLSGRCISGDFLAHASYRVMGDAMAIGAGAGACAGTAAKQNLLPAQVRFEDMKPVIDPLEKAIAGNP